MKTLKPHLSSIGDVGANAMAVACYIVLLLFWSFGALVLGLVIIAERRSALVRFHAAQALLLWLARTLLGGDMHFLGLASVLTGDLGYMQAPPGWTGSALDVALRLLAVVLVILLAVGGIYHAYRWDIWKIPILGQLASLFCRACRPVLYDGGDVVPEECRMPLPTKPRWRQKYLGEDPDGEWLDEPDEEEALLLSEGDGAAALPDEEPEEERAAPALAAAEEYSAEAEPAAAETFDLYEDYETAGAEEEPEAEVKAEAVEAAGQPDGLDRAYRPPADAEGIDYDEDGREAAGAVRQTVWTRLAGLLRRERAETPPLDEEGTPPADADTAGEDEDGQAAATAAARPPVWARLTGLLRRERAETPPLDEEWTLPADVGDAGADEDGQATANAARQPVWSRLAGLLKREKAGAPPLAQYGPDNTPPAGMQDEKPGAPAGRLPALRQAAAARASAVKNRLTAFFRVDADDPDTPEDACGQAEEYLYAQAEEAAPTPEDAPAAEGDAETTLHVVAQGARAAGEPDKKRFKALARPGDYLDEGFGGEPWGQSSGEGKRMKGKLLQDLPAPKGMQDSDVPADMRDPPPPQDV